MKILLIINPTSGKKANDRVILRIHELAVIHNLDFKFLYTTGESDDKKIQYEISSYQPDRVIAGGGDGTVQLVAKNLIDKNVLMGIIPLGSANGMVTALGLPSNPVRAVNETLVATGYIPLDLLRFNDKHICIHLGDIGVNARMVKKYDEEDKKGMMGYARYLLRSIRESPLMKYTIKTPEGVYEKEGYMLAFANAHKYGTGVHISQGDAWDGKFEICNVPEIALDQAIKAGLTILNVFVDKDMFSDVISCRSAEISIDQKADLQIDGEYMGTTDFLKIEIIPSAIKLLVPDVK
jgi:diacylglycerol kinase family enzyme